MELITTGNLDYVYDGKFTGPVRLEMLVEAAVDTDPDIARVHFDDGAVTNWHSHPGGQVLVLVSGTGRVGSATLGTVAGIAPGTLVRTPEGEEHWHGADAGASAVWLCTTWGVTHWHDASPLDATPSEATS